MKIPQVKCHILTDDGVLHTCSGSTAREVATLATEMIADFLARDLKLAAVLADESAGLWHYLVDFYQTECRLKSKQRGLRVS